MEPGARGGESNGQSLTESDFLAAACDCSVELES